MREAVEIYGRRWTEIVDRYFPNRTPIAAKNRFVVLSHINFVAPSNEVLSLTWLWLLDIRNALVAIKPMGQYRSLPGMPPKRKARW